MTDNAIEVRGVSKRYRLGDRATAGSLREALTGGLRRAAPGRRRRREPAGAHRDGDHGEVWSLRDVSFDVRRGEAVGVVGRNGAGKSTLLKVLTRITEPTVGVARTRGRVASLLEVGTGFHLELTGRENVFLNGSILGMSRRDIAARFDSIVDFAGVERFIDTPVKRYSSGMYLRLAFAVAAHVEPDVLVVDEILAVGDAEFQRKCLDGMSLAEAEGRTLVFVSHDLDAIARLCRRALWMDAGRLRLDGETGEVLDAYLRSAREAPGAEARAMADPAGRVALQRISVVDGSGRPVAIIRRDQPFAIEIDMTLQARIPGFDLAVYLVNRRGVRVFDEAWSDTAATRVEGPGRHVVRVAVPPVLNVGDYAIGLWVGSGYEEIMDVHAAQGVTIEGSDRGRPDRVVELALPWDVRPAAANGQPGLPGRRSAQVEAEAEGSPA